MLTKVLRYKGIENCNVVYHSTVLRNLDIVKCDYKYIFLFRQIILTVLVIIKLLFRLDKFDEKSSDVNKRTKELISKNYVNKEN